MINAANGRVVMFGAREVLMSECTAILTGFYQNISKEFGEEVANELLVAMGRAAVDPKTAEEKIHNMFCAEISIDKK